MGIILNLETATTNCSVSLAKDGTLLNLKEHNAAGYSHSEQLHLFIEQLLQETSVGVSELDAVAVSSGPGSYTGLRIGVSAAKGLCFALDIPLIAVSTLQSMAYQKSIAEGHLIPVLDARRMEVYAAVFNAAYKEVRETEAEIINEKSFEAYTDLGKVYLMGSGAEKCSALLKHPNFIFEKEVVPSAAQMCSLSFKKFTGNDFEDLAYFEPSYLKDFLGNKK